jgi:hypothetical protein
MKHNLIEKYNLPSEVIFCKKCTISNQRPRITFDKNGVCSACNFSDYKQTSTDWKKRENELQELCDKFRKKNGEYDVIVPCSGGKDNINGCQFHPEKSGEVGLNILRRFLLQ